MIVCHCNRLDHTAIEAAADRLAASDRWRLVTPVAVYKALGCRPRCGGCLPLAANIIHTRAVGRASKLQPCPLAVLTDEGGDTIVPVPVPAPRPWLDAAE